MKEIKKLKIALTSSCTLRCNHCKINKNSNLDIDLKKSIAGVDFLLSSPGAYKRLELYGGEPFLRFSLLKEISSYARKKAKEKRKKLSLSIATNATLLDREKILWIKEIGANISISFSGSEESHNYNRKFASGIGSHLIVSKNLKKLFKKVNKEYLVCLYCIDGAFANKMRDDFNLILKSGFRIVNVECVSGRGWSQENYSDFEYGFLWILEKIREGIERGDFVFLESFIEMISDKKSWDYSCPAYRDLEMYPDGNYGFYPYAFVDYEKVKKKISIGNWKNGLNKHYSSCFPNCLECSTCCQKYYTLPGLSDGSYAYELRSHMMKKFFFNLLRRRNERKINKYLNDLKKIRTIRYV